MKICSSVFFFLAIANAEVKLVSAADEFPSNKFNCPKPIKFKCPASLAAFPLSKYTFAESCFSNAKYT